MKGDTVFSTASVARDAVQMVACISPTLGPHWRREAVRRATINDPTAATRISKVGEQALS